MNSRRALRIAAVAVLIAVLLLPSLLLTEDKLLELAKTAIREQTGAALEVEGAVDLKLVPRISISLGDVSLTFPEQEQTDLQVESLQLALQWIPLLSGKVEIELLTLSNSIVEVRNAEQTAPTIIALSRIQARGFNLDARPIEIEASISAPTEPPAEVELDGSLRFDQARQVVMLDTVIVEITGLTPQPLRLQTRGEFDIGQQIASLQLELKLAEANGEGTLRYSTLESPTIDATLHFDQFDPALLVLAGPDAASEVQGNSDGGDPLPLEALRNIDTRVSLSIDKSLLVGHVVETLQLAIQARDGLINIESLTATLHGGQLAMEGSIDARGDSALVSTNGNVAGLDIASALRSGAAEPMATGRAHLDWKLTGEGRSQNELLAGLAGPIALTTTGVVLQDLGIEKMLCQAVALSNQEALTASFPASTRFQTLTADIQLKNGKALMRPLRAELAHIALSGNGAYELLSKDFRATFKGRLSPELETLDPACRVSKRLVAIDWPVDCKGNAAGEPASWCSVDTQKILKDLTKDEAKNKLQKKADKLLDKLFN